MQRDSKFIIWAVVVLLFAGVVIWGIYSKKGPTAGTPPAPPPPNPSLQPVAVPTRETLMGKIDTIQGQTFTLALSAGASAANSAQTKKITVDSSTTFEKIVFKDPAVMQKELLAYNAKTADSGTRTAPPAPFEKVTISLSDLKKGDSLIVTVISGSAAGDAAKATDVIVQPVVATQ